MYRNIANMLADRVIATTETPAKAGFRNSD
jgi:hypothetical protein